MFEIFLILLASFAIFAISVEIVSRVHKSTRGNASRLVWGWLQEIFVPQAQPPQPVPFYVPGYDSLNDRFDAREIETTFRTTLSHFDGVYWDSKRSGCVSNTVHYAFSFARADEEMSNVDYLTGLAEADLHRFYHSRLADTACSPLTACSLSGNVLYLAVACNSAGCPEIAELREKIRATNACDNAPATADDIEV